MKLFVILLSFCFSLSACVPFPHREVVVPDISATILEAGQPVSEARFIFGRSKAESVACDMEFASTLTDDNGHVEIYPQYNFQWVLMILGDPVADWELCLKRSTEMTRLWKAQYIGDLPSKLKLICDLASNETVFQRLNLYGHGRCEFE